MSTDELKFLLAKTLYENGSHMEVTELAQKPEVAPALRKSIGSQAPQFMERFPDLFHVEETLGQPGHKTVTLIGDVPPKPTRAAQPMGGMGESAWGGRGKAAGAGGGGFGARGGRSEPELRPEIQESMRQALLAAVLAKISQNEGEMELGLIGSDPAIVVMRKGVVQNLSQWLSKHKDLVELYDGPPLVEGKPARKLAKLTPAGWLAAQASPMVTLGEMAPGAAAMPVAKRQRMIADSPAAEVQQPREPLTEEQRQERALKSREASARLVEAIRDLLLVAEGNKMKLEDVALLDSIKELKKDCPKGKRLGHLLKEEENEAIFDVFEAPRSEGATQSCMWVSLK